MHAPEFGSEDTVTTFKTGESNEGNFGDWFSDEFEDEDEIDPFSPLQASSYSLRGGPIARSCSTEEAKDSEVFKLLDSIIVVYGIL
jgi:hypothetical protein